MGEELRLKITQVQIDKPIATQQLQNQLNEISKNLKVTVNIDAKQMKEIDSAIKKLHSQITSSTGKGISIFDSKEVDRSKNIITSIEQAVKEYQKFGTIKVNKDFIDPITNQVKEFTLSITKSEGEVEKLKFKLAELAGVKGLPNGSFVPVKGAATDNTQAVAVKNLQAEQKQRQDYVQWWQRATVTIAENERKEIAKTQQSRQAYQDWWAKALFNQDQQQQKNSQAEIARIEQQRKAYEQWWQKSLANQDQQQRKQQQATVASLDTYKRQAEIQATGLLNNKNKILSPDQTTALNNYLNAVRNLNAQTPQLSQRMQQLGLDFKEISAGAQQASYRAMTLGEAFKTAISKFSIWMGASTIFFQSLRFITNGISYINELNKALTEVSIVTGKNQEEVAKLGEEYNKLGQKMGVTTAELAKTAASLFRQGLGEEEVTKRMQTITEYAKISSLDVTQATEIMTAAINSMGVSAEKAADVWSYMGDATATGADEIGRAFQKVGGSAGALNLDFSKVSSWISVISSRTRESAETIGQSVKSILARVQSMKETGFSEEDGTKVNQVAKALAQVGVQLVDSGGQFRNFGTVMDELGSRWSNLDSRTKAYVATTVAGIKF